MAGSIERVTQAAEAAGLAITVRRMGASTRTAEEAATQCGCDVAQIVKSLVFQGERTGELYLFLLSGPNRLDLDKAAALAGEPLTRADPRHVRDVTGFAIGGVSPLGHLVDLPTFADESLLCWPTVFAAAGAHDAIFEAEPKALVSAAKARISALSASKLVP